MSNSLQTYQTWVILVAGGSGNRFGSETPKQFLSLSGCPVIEHSFLRFSSLKEEIAGLVLVLAQDYLSYWKNYFEQKFGTEFSTPIRFIQGGKTRQESVTQGFEQLPQDCHWVVIHDAARPLVTEELIKNCITKAQKHGAAIAASPLADTLKRADTKKRVQETLTRENLYRIQTPQVFSKKLLGEALVWAKKNQFDATDEATLLEKIGQTVHLVEAPSSNFKITEKEDLIMAEALLQHQKKKQPQLNTLRIGEGYDVHRWESGYELFLGGVKIPFEKGLKGHSDADALLHAICDALLGAIGAGDIGKHFPDSDPQYRGISSLKLLKHVFQLIKDANYQINNLDATVICQRPKLADYIPEMRANIAETLETPQENINVKATTEEGLGFTGNGEGLAARAVVLLSKI